MLTVAENAPDAGDVVWIDFGPPVGHEQAGRRPALVLSTRDYNANSSMVIVCPITRSERSWPFKVLLVPVGSLRGYVLVDQIRAVDRTTRALRPHGRAAGDTVDAVHEMLGLILGKA
ncbi:type II toxin-antitoxin system PemK/MazF family toxin [Microbaculum marinum]|uniref:Type II toxin-antitoxin system PemK/MazF family toxin n=1 Tax=Microbaculum marinum TaxID=1764581 RepID=A0AAW9S3H1_9HYPH